MALDVTPSGLWHECDNAIRFRKRRTDPTDAMIEQFKTPWHGDSPSDGSSHLTTFDSRNHPFEYIALTIANVVFDNPRWQVTARSGLASDIDAPALEFALNRWTKDVRLKKLLVKLYCDFCFSLATFKVRMIDDPVWVNTDKPRKRPEVCRVGPKLGFFDARVFDREERLFTGDIYIADRQGLLKSKPEEGWNKDALKQLANSSGVQKIRPDHGSDDYSRDECALIQVHVPGYDLPDNDPFWRDVSDDDRVGYHGTWFTMPLEGYGRDAKARAEFVRDPRPFWGGVRGPYGIGDAYYVPDDPMGLSMITAGHGQGMQDNAVQRALFEAIKEYKRIYVDGSGSPTFGALVKTAMQGDVIAAKMPDPTRMLMPLELGGVTPALLQAAQITRELADHAYGMSDAFRGNVTGQATAFENSVAMAGSTARMAYPRQQFMDLLGDMGYAVAEMMHMSEEVVLDLESGLGEFIGGDPDAHREKIVEELESRGFDEATAHRFVDITSENWKNTPLSSMDIEVEPMSTARASEASNQQRVAALAGIVVQIGQAQMSMPGMDFTPILKMVGQAFEFPGIAKIFDKQTLVQAGQQAANGPAPAPTGQPVLANDTTQGPPMSRAITPKQKNTGGKAAPALLKMTGSDTY